MKYQNSTERFQTLIDMALELYETAGADALIVLAEGPMNWERLKEQAGEKRFLVATETKDQLGDAQIAEIPAVLLGNPDNPVHERVTNALLECVADEILAPGSRVIAIYSGFEADTIDSVSIINLGEHLERLTARDLRQLETRVPLETLKLVVDLALDIGYEGREGKPVGTIFVIGDHRKVLKQSRPVGFDAVKGYGRKDRNLNDRKVREAVKEVAQLDGAFVVSSDGTVEGTCRYLDAPATGITLSQGLGTRHWAAASISRITNSVAVSVSQSSGTVRIFQNGEVLLRIEPFRRRPMKWKEFDYEPPAVKVDED